MSTSFYDRSLLKISRLGDMLAGVWKHGEHVRSL